MILCARSNYFRNMLHPDGAFFESGARPTGMVPTAQQPDESEKCATSNYENKVEDGEKVNVSGIVCNASSFTGKKRKTANGCVEGSQSNNFLTNQRGQQVINLPDINVAAFEGVLGFLYTGECDMSIGLALETMVVASRFRIERLERLIEEHLVRSIDV